MKSFNTLFVLLVILGYAISASGTGGDDEKILLQLRLKQGGIYKQNTSWQTSIVQVIDNDTVRYQEIMNLGSMIDVESVDSTGTASVVITIVSYYVKKEDTHHLYHHYEYHSSDEKAPLHFDAMAYYCFLNRPISMRLTPLGKISNIQGVDSMISDLISLYDEQTKKSVLVYNPQLDTWIWEDKDFYGEIYTSEEWEWDEAGPVFWEEVTTETIEELDDFDLEGWEIEFIEEIEDEDDFGWEEYLSSYTPERVTGREDYLVSDLTTELTDWVDGFLLNVLGNAGSMYTDIPLGIGDTWNTTHSMNMLVTTDFELCWTLKERSGGILTLELASVVSMNQGVVPYWLYGDSIRFELSGEQEGVFYVDESTGWILSGEMRQHFSGVVYIDDTSEVITHEHPFIVDSLIQIETPEDSEHR